MREPNELKQPLARRDPGEVGGGPRREVPGERARQLVPAVATVERAADDLPGEREGERVAGAGGHRLVAVAIDVDRADELQLAVIESVVPGGLAPCHGQELTWSGERKHTRAAAPQRDDPVMARR